MHSTVQASTTTNTSKQSTKFVADYVYVVQLHDGRFVIGAANNPCKRIAELNTGWYDAVPKSLQVNNIVGIKEQNEERTLMSVTSKFCDRYGVDNVITI